MSENGSESLISLMALPIGFSEMVCVGGSWSVGLERALTYVSGLSGGFGGWSVLIYPKELWGIFLVLGSFFVLGRGGDAKIGCCGFSSCCYAL